MNKAERQTAQASLNSEKKVLRQLEEVFTQAKQDCTDAIKALNARTDMQNLESIVYQTQYQQAISNQIDGILDALHTQDFNTIAQYLTECYENGYIGAMYDLQTQGVPITTPINQNQVVKAIQTDSKLSKNLYDSLGEDIDVLKASVSSELSRGIASGKSWLDIADNLAQGFNSPYDTALFCSERIARTEGHRVQEEAQFDAIQEAKDEGADVVKQWDATLDDRTRPEHQELDGQIREIDEPFEVDGYSAMYPGDFGAPEMDINCRCVVTQRAKWALTEGELQTLKDQAKYYGLDKTKNFEEYKEKFLIIEEQNNIINNTIETKTPETKTSLKFTDRDELVDYFANNKSQQQWENNLTETEKDNIRQYTADDYCIINEVLRDENTASEYWSQVSIDKAKVRAAEINNVISKATLDEPLTVYRQTGLNSTGANSIDELQNLVGTEYSDKGFMSASPIEEATEYFGTEEFKENYWVEYEINIPAGTGNGAYISPFSEYPGESEYLIKSGAKFEITAVEKHKIKMVMKDD